MKESDYMKKNIIKISILLIIVILCSACNGNVTRDIRHDGFVVSNTFKCESFIPSEKKVSYSKIMYLTNSNIIDDKGKIYEISMGQVYSNKQNCKEANTSIRVKAIFDDKIIKGYDNKYYYLVGQNTVPNYSEVLNTDNSYEIYNLLLKDNDVVKVVTADSSKGLYYVLKSDGNVYANTIVKEDNIYKVVGVKIIYDKNTYSSKIIDFNYMGESLNTYIKTEDKIYRMKITNKDCLKYADVNCVYKLEEDTVLGKYIDRIVIFNGNYLITDYRQVFTVNE